jgi:hypothetical protein
VSLRRSEATPTFADIFRDGTGVVEFESRDEVQRIIKKFDESRFQGKTIYLKEVRELAGSGFYYALRFVSVLTCVSTTGPR